MSGITRDLWLDAISGAIPTANPDALTAAEFAKKYGFKISTARARLKVLEEAGSVKRVKKSITDTAGRVQFVGAWLLVKATKKPKR